jgi:hypothetical protein
LIRKQIIQERDNVFYNLLPSVLLIVSRRNSKSGSV